MPSTVVLKASGLNTSPNELSVPEGSLIEASNIIIKRDNIVEPRRGFKLYGESFGSSIDRPKQLLVYKDRILRHYNTTIQFENGTNNDGSVNFDNFSGSYSEVDAGLRIKSIESNANLYFTTSEGIKKLSASSASQLSTSSGYITQAGGIKAVDAQARLDITLGDQTSFFTQDSAVAYRIVWGIKDANNNTILGSPSQRIVVYNPLLSLLLRDYNRLLGALDDINQSGSLITDGNYVSTLGLNSSDTATTLRTNLLSLVSKIDADILYANDSGTGAPLNISAAAGTANDTVTITFSAGVPTDYWTTGGNGKIYLAGFGVGSSTSTDINGARTVVTADATTITLSVTGVTAADTFAFTSGTIVSNEYRSITQPSAPSEPATTAQLEAIQTYIDGIITRLIAEPTAVISNTLSTSYIDVLDITRAASVVLDITIPEEVTLDHFYQIYRSDVALSSGTTILLNDITPSDELQLTYEAYPTQTDLDNRLVTVEDNTLDTFKGANLYTNPTTGEGILQANDLPPLAKDINRFKNVVFYANTKTRHRKNVSLLGVANMITDYNNSITPKFVITDDNYANTYSFVTGLEEKTDITCVADVADSLNGKYFLINSAKNVNQYYVWYKTSGGVETDPAVSGKTGIKVLISTGDSANNVATKTKNTLNRLIHDFIVTDNTLPTIRITNIDSGYTDNASAGTSGFTISVNQEGRGEKVTRETSVFTTVADVAGSLAGTYFTLNTAFNQDQYYVWYKVSGGGADPAVANKTGVQVDITTGDSASTVATKTKTKLDTLTDKFITTANSSTLTIKNYRFGPANDSTAGTSGFSLSISEQGALEVLLSTLTSPSQAVDETARSLVKVINKNETEEVYAYYLSGVDDAPGKMLFESRNLSNPSFYLLGNNSNTGASFNPDITPDVTISSISTGSATTMLVTTSSAHGLVNQDQVVIVNSNCTPSIDGLHEVTYVSPTTFRLNFTITSSGTSGSLSNASVTEISDNEVKPNRIYYSKIQQPEAVPILNYFDVGAETEEILRIFPLRDSLFVFKSDGLFRVSGELSPFNLALFDSSCGLIAPDTVAVSNNLIYCWTAEGIVTVSESGVTVISRPIDDQILKLASSNYNNFSTASWGIGYDSDNSYIVWTVSTTVDTVATIAYRFSTLTNTWTTFDKTNTCGIVNPRDDRLYLGAGDTNSIEMERKSFDRTDYADREIEKELISGNYNGAVIKLSDVSDVAIGDVLYQEQLLTVFEYNMLLRKLDNDTLGDNDYLTDLEADGGDNLRTKIVDLANKLDADSQVVDTDYFSTIDDQTGAITAITAASSAIITSTSHGLQTGRIVTIAGSDCSPSIDGTFEVTVIDANNFSIPYTVTSPGTTGSFSSQSTDFRDIKACYNAVVRKLNSDTGVSFNNYQEVDTVTGIEAVITSINTGSKEVTLNIELDYVIGELTLFKAISSTFTYAPNTFGDPLNLKHVREATVMFIRKTFTSATAAFASDLVPEFTEVDFNGDGNGSFGYTTFGEGFFGGASHSAPFRTYIPRKQQRCRYLLFRFDHQVARETYGITGVSLTGEVGQSSRAFR